jgi:sugar phosphate isomerase/epimerase
MMPHPSNLRYRLAAAALGSIFLAVSALAQAAVRPASVTNAFFAMDTAFGGGPARSPADQAALLKELGYAGIGVSGHPGEDVLAAFEKQGLRVFNTYLTLSFDSAKPGLDPKLTQFVPRLKGHHTDLWIAINAVTKDGSKLKPSDAEGDAVVAPALRELAELAQASGVRIAFYPHTWCWLERVEDGVRLAKRVDRPNVGATFNLCHWLKVEGDRDPKPVLRAALPLLFFVSINGADGGETKTLNWDRLIQPLDRGSWDVAGLVHSLSAMGYRGPIGFQGYGLKGDARDVLRQTMNGWQRLTTSAQPEQ